MRQSIGQFIAILRKSKGITQQQLADTLNVSNKTVSKWERDESTPDITLLPIMAEILGVTCQELVQGKVSEEVAVSTVSNEGGKRLLDRAVQRYTAKNIVLTGIILLSLLLGVLMTWYGHENSDTAELLGILIMIVVPLSCCIANIVYLYNYANQGDSSIIDANHIRACNTKVYKDVRIFFGIILAGIAVFLGERFFVTPASLLWPFAICLYLPLVISNRMLTKRNIINSTTFAIRTAIDRVYIIIAIVLGVLLVVLSRGSMYDQSIYVTPCNISAILLAIVTIAHMVVCGVASKRHQV